MTTTSIMRTAAIFLTICSVLPAYALDLPTIDSFIGGGTGIEQCHGDLNQQAAHSFCNGIRLVKASSSSITIEGFYKGNFDITMGYLLGKGSINSGPYAGRTMRPDGTPADYAGKYLTVKRVLGINTKLGAFYFNIPDTLGLKQTLEGLMTLSTSYESNRFGGHDYTFNAVAVSGETAQTILSIITKLIPSDGSGLSPEIMQQLIDALTDDTDISIGAIQLLVADDTNGTNTTKVATMEKYTVTTYAANATATDNYDISRNSTPRSYPVSLNLDRTNGTLTILNFGNNGAAIADSLYDVTVEHTDTAGNVTTTTRKMLTTTVHPVTGTFDWNKGTFVIPAQQTAIDISLYNPLTSYLGNITIGHGSLNQARKSLLGWSADTQNPDITGTFTHTEGEMHHSGSNLWHSNISGGDLHTLSETSIEMNVYGTYTTYWGLSGLLDNSKNIFTSDSHLTMSAGDTDVTHDVKIGPTELPKYTGMGVNSTSNGQEEEVFGTLVPKGSTQHIDHYEIYIHHTKVNSITTTPLIGNYDADKGIKNSVNIGTVAVPVNASEGASFYFRVPVSDIPNNNSKPLFGSQPAIDLTKDHFAMYVKTVYNNGLAPTFHALHGDLAPLGITTHADEIISDTILSAIGTKGAIRISSTLPVEIYDLSGHRCYQGKDTIVSLPAGIYIVRSSNKVIKVTVK